MTDERDATPPSTSPPSTSPPANTDDGPPADAADEAARAEGPGLREDPEGGPFVVDAEGAVVDTGSPQDYGEPNEDVERFDR